MRPGTDGALALGIANLMIERGWYDRDFIRDWSNGPLLVRADTGRLLTERDLAPDGDARRALRLGQRGGAAGAVRHQRPAATTATAPSLALDGEYRIATPHGEVVCHPAFELYRRLCRRYPPETVEAICWIPRAQVEEAARLIWHARPVSYYAWSGHEQHANATQTARAMSLLYALTGCFDEPGGNVLFAGAAGRADHRRGSARGTSAWPRRWASPSARSGRRAGATSRTRDLYRAILEGDALPGARPGRLRRQHAAGPCRRRDTGARRWRRWTSTPMPTCS